MFNLILISHGNFSSGILHAAELILGKQENVYIFSVQKNCDLEQLKSRIADQLQLSATSDVDVLILTDLFFGTPFNIVNSLMERFNFQHVTGMNLPLLIEIMSRRNEESIINILSEALPAAKGAMIDCVAYFNSD